MAIPLLLSGGTVASAKSIDPRLAEISQFIESRNFDEVNRVYFLSEWSQQVLAGLSDEDRARLVKLIRKAKKPEIREAHVEQYRIGFRSREIPDSECILSFYLDARPGDGKRPTLAFSTYGPAVVDLMSEALDKNQLPLVLSFFDPSSTWGESLKMMKEPEMKNLARACRAMTLIKQGEDERLYTGTYAGKDGIERRIELNLQKSLDGRWRIQ